MFVKVNDEKDALKLSKLIGKESFILLVHADWCFHCQAFTSVWTQFTDEHARNNSSLMVFDLEHTALMKLKSWTSHELQDLKDLLKHVNGFPSLVKVKEAEKSVSSSAPVVEIVHFDKSRTLENVVEFSKGM
jgi:thiol:disulfide interchange protein